MQYRGSKARIRKYILPIILEEIKGRSYVEPFVGGAHMVQGVPHNINRVVNDNNYYLIEMLKAIQSGWVPPTELGREEYYTIRAFQHRYDPWLVGFAGLGCSFGGTYFSGYSKGKNGSGVADIAHRALMKQKPLLEGVTFFSGTYKKTPIPLRSVIYCDPPYRNTVHHGYITTSSCNKSFTGWNGGRNNNPNSDKQFNYEELWIWCLTLALQGHIVFVSELGGPTNPSLEKFFEVVLEIKMNSNSSPKNGGREMSKRTKTEKLFRCKFGTTRTLHDDMRYYHGIEIDLTTQIKRGFQHARRI